MITTKIVEIVSTFMICTYYSEEIIESHNFKIQHISTQNVIIFYSSVLCYISGFNISASRLNYLPYPLPSGVVVVVIVVVEVVGIDVLGVVIVVVEVVGIVVLGVGGRVFILSTIIQELPTNDGISITTRTTRTTKLER